MKLHEDRALAHALLDAGGAAEGKTVSERIVAIARRWLQVTAGSEHHTEGCQCHLCIAARRINSEAKRHGI